MAAVPTLHINVKFGAQKVATGGTLTCQLHITDSFTLEAAPLTKPPALRGVSDWATPVVSVMLNVM